MTRSAIVLFCLTLILFAPLPAAASGPSAAADIAAFLPELQGWQKSGSAETYAPETLYEHIDGAAENFLAYGFEKLAVQNYANRDRQALTAEIYFHGTPENAFGIYSSEKPLAGNYIQVGGQGYEEEGVLNFVNGAFYVKLNGFDLGPAQAGVLKALAEKIALAINGPNTLPAILGVFPALGKVAHSERYIAGNFLGHEFLLPAFTADYELQGKKFRLFIMKTGDEEKSRSLLRRYAALDKESVAGEIRPGAMTVNDPYNGTVRISWQGAYIWGATGQQSEAAAHIEEIARNLAGR